MPARKLPTDWKPRLIAVLRAAVKINRGPRYGAAHVRERDDRIIEMAIAEAERVELEMLKANPMTSDPLFVKACGVAADRLSAPPRRKKSA